MRFEDVLMLVLGLAQITFGVGSLVIDPSGALLILGPILCCAGTVLLWITWSEFRDYRDRYSPSKGR